MSMTSDIKLGHTTLRVWRRVINEKTKREQILQIHEGIAVAVTSLFVRIFNPAPISKGGDPAPEFAQYFPMNSNLCWCEITGQTKDKIRLPVSYSV